MDRIVPYLPDLDTVLNLIALVVFIFLVWVAIVVGMLWVLNKRARAWMLKTFTAEEIDQLDQWDIIPIRMGIPLDMPVIDDTNVVYPEAWQEAAE